MITEKRELIQSIILKLGIDKEDNPEKILFNNKDTDREYQIKLAKDTWGEDISIDDKYWYPEDSYYMSDTTFKGFKRLITIEYGNIEDMDKPFLKFGEWRKKFKIYYNYEDKKILVFVNYGICKDKEWNVSVTKRFIGIFDNN